MVAQNRNQHAQNALSESIPKLDPIKNPNHDTSAQTQSDHNDDHHLGQQHSDTDIDVSHIAPPNADEDNDGSGLT